MAVIGGVVGSGYGQSDDLLDGMVTPGLRFFPRELREVMVYEDPWVGRTPAPTRRRVEFDERDQRRRAADVFSLEQAELLKRRIGDAVDVHVRTDRDLDADVFDFKGYLAHFSTRSEELSYQARIRFKVEIPDHDAGIMFYYRHRERFDRAESERTKWAGAQNMPEGADTAFIYEHELRSSPEDEVMDEVGAVLRWHFTPGSRLLVGGTYRKQEDHLLEQRLEFDTRAGTAELPGEAPRRGYPYDPATDVVAGGIVREATMQTNRGRVERQLKDEVEDKERWGGFIDFRHEYGENSWFDFQGDYSKRTNREPDRRDTEFSNRPDAMWSYSIVGGRPIFEQVPIPDVGYTNRKVELENNLKQREYLYGQALVHHQVVPGHIVEGGLFGLRHGDKRDINYERYEQVAGFPGDHFTSVGSGGAVDGVLGRPSWPEMDAGLARGFFDANRGFYRLMEAETFFKNFGEDYDMTREIGGGHLLYRHDRGDRWRVHVGARLERARTFGTAYDAQWTGNEPAGRPVRVQSAVRATSSSKTETDVLPTLLVEYAPERGVHYSANLRQTLQRPELREAAPSRYFHEDGGVEPRASLGNPDLDSSRNTQLVVVRNHAFAPGSMLRVRAEAWHLEQPLTSAGWFAPHALDNAEITAARPLRNYRFEQTLNGDSGELLRFGLHYAHTFHALPHPFDQLGVFSFFDYTHSSQEATVNGQKRKTPVTYQPEQRGGGGFFYRSNRWQGSLFADFHSKYLVSVGERANGLSGTGDLWVDDRVTLNANLTYRVTEDLEIYTEINNLTDTEFRMYEGTDQRQTLREKVGRQVRLGVHWTF